MRYISWASGKRLEMSMVGLMAWYGLAGVNLRSQTTMSSVKTSGFSNNAVGLVPKSSSSLNGTPYSRIVPSLINSLIIMNDSCSVVSGDRKRYCNGSSSFALHVAPLRGMGKDTS